jgi:hypothetical protein
MSVSMRHVLEQGPMLRTMGRAALSVLQRKTGAGPRPATPGDWIVADVAPPSDALVRSFVKNAGGDPQVYRGRLPPHLFPQWALPVASRVFDDLPFPIVRVVNAGCRFEARAPLPAGEPLRVAARLERIDENDVRVIVTTRIVTGTASTPEALDAELRTFIPLPRKKDGSTKRGAADGRERRIALVPADAREIAYVRLGAEAGLDFAKLTGDFNPIHWVPAYARAAGFPSAILHGFGTFALAVEALVRRSFSGEAERLRCVDARFTKPLALPGRVGVYVADTDGAGGDVFVGAAPGAAAHLEGRFESTGGADR